MTIYHTFLDDSGAGAETILGIQQNGSEYGVGISTDIVCNNISAVISTLGVTTTTNLTAKQLNVSGITTSSGGISNGTNTLSFTVAGSNLTLTVAGVGSTTLKLF